MPSGIEPVKIEAGGFVRLTSYIEMYHETGMMIKRRQTFPKDWCVHKANLQQIFYPEGKIYCYVFLSYNHNKSDVQ